MTLAPVDKSGTSYEHGDIAERKSSRLLDVKYDMFTLSVSTQVLNDNKPQVQKASELHSCMLMNLSATTAEKQRRSKPSFNFPKKEEEGERGGSE